MIPPTGIEHLQKVSDIYDWFDPAVDHIARDILKATPGSNRRLWEFSMIYLALAKNGKLVPDATGLAMGAGTERLIYAVAPRVNKAVITDLYLPDSQWVGVRTADPQQLVLERAPWPVPAEKIQAIAMDMRELKFDDDSFDFAWSTGAFEHIGADEDFQRHLSEVHRVLKPGGVYAFTTVVNFGTETDRIPHNYYFYPEHLVQLLDASPLCPEPVFDCRVRDHHFNRPMLERYQNFGFEAGNLLSHPVVSLRRGVITDANLVVLRKLGPEHKQKTQLLGFDKSRTYLRRRVDALLDRTWKAWQNVGTEVHGNTLRTQPHQFVPGPVEARFASFAEKPGAFKLELHSRRYSHPVDSTLVRRWSKLLAGASPLSWTAEPGLLYFMVITAVESKQPAPDLVIQCRAATGEPAAG
jgi:SAM-dependent methyltransferase